MLNWTFNAITLVVLVGLAIALTGGDDSSSPSLLVTENAQQTESLEHEAALFTEPSQLALLAVQQAELTTPQPQQRRLERGAPTQLPELPPQQPEPLSPSEFDDQFYQQFADRVLYDEFGNQFVHLPAEREGLSHYILSDWPLYYPTPSERDLASVDGCMSFKYYVSESAALTLLIVEKGVTRTYHFTCTFDATTQQYRLAHRNSGAPQLQESIQSLRARLPRRNQ